MLLAVAAVAGILWGGASVPAHGPSAGTNGRDPAFRAFRGQDPQWDRRARAYELAYSLDFDEAVLAFRAAIAADPSDAAAWRGLAATTWIRVLFDRGSIMVDDYLGALSSAEIPMPPPAPELARAFRESIERSVAIAEQRLQAHPGGAAALYDVGAALAIRVSWMASVEGKVLGALRSARRAFSAHERVLELDPTRLDAGLVAGTYRYAISQLAAPLRWFAYLVGFGGGKERGIRLIEQAASHPGDAQTDAQLALILIYNREGRPRDALAVIDRLRAQLPRNRLLWLEYGASAVRAGLGAEAEQALSEGLRRFASDTRSRAPGEEARWRLALGAARVLLGRPVEATAELRAALAFMPRDWIRGHIYLEIGKAADISSDRAAANTAYRTAVYYCERDNDTDGAAQARRLMATPFSRPR